LNDRIGLGLLVVLAVFTFLRNLPGSALAP
jgi:hypothetical protein